MEPATYNLTIYRDRDFSQGFVFKDTDGVVINLTGYSAQAQIRPTEGSAVKIAEFACDIVAIEGKVTISLTDAQTLAISSDYMKGWWDLVLTDPSGLREGYIKGSVAINQTVTRVA